jgi:hypothetical protein
MRSATSSYDFPCTTPTTIGFLNSGGGIFGGTSASAPSLAGLLAIIEQANGSSALGNINPMLYSLAEGVSAKTIFHDITAGNNIVACTGGTTGCSSTSGLTNGTMGFSAGLGYDQVTGLGSIDAASLRAGLAGINAKSATLLLTASINAPAPTAPVTFTLKLTGSASSAPTGTVQFAVDGTNVGAAVTVTSGVATYAYAGFSATGSHTVVATYSGDSNYSTGTATINLQVTQETPTIAISASSLTPRVNTPVTLTATLSAVNGTPTGTVQFYLFHAQVGSPVALVNGVASYTYSGFPTAEAGDASPVNAQYLGNTEFTGVTSAFITVTPASPSATLTPTLSVSVSPANPSIFNTLTFTATVSGSGPTPTGVVGFALDGAPIAFTQSGLVAGVATAINSVSAGGSHTITATYGGDTNYKIASTTFTFAVSSPSFTAAFTPSTMTLANGSSGIGTLSITAANGFGFGGSLNLLYSYTSSTGTTFPGCLKSGTASVSGVVLSVPITVYTTSANCTGAAVMQQQHAQHRDVPSPWQQRLGAISAATVVCCFFGRRRIRPGLLALLVITLVAFGLNGCSASGSGGGSSSSATYVFTQVVTSGSLQASTTFTVNVH